MSNKKGNLKNAKIYALKGAWILACRAGNNRAFHPEIK
jgi:hypothetical protein